MKQKPKELPRKSWLLNRWILLSLFSALLVFLTAVLTFKASRSLSQKKATQTDLTEGSEIILPKKTIQWESTEAGTWFPFGRNLLSVRPEQVAMYDLNKTQLFSAPTTLLRPIVFSRGSAIFCGDRASGQLTVLKPSGIQFQNQLDGVLAGADYTANEGGRYAILDEVAQKNTKIHLMNESGIRLFTLTFEQSGNPVQTRLTPDGKNLDVLILNTRGDRIKTILRRFDLSGGQVAQKVVEGYDDLFFGLTHSASGTPYIYSQTTVLALDFSSEPCQLIGHFSEVVEVSPQGKSVFIMGQGDDDSGLMVYQMTPQGELRKKLEQDVAWPEAWCVTGDRFVFSSGTQLRQYRFGDDRVTDLGRLSEPVTRLTSAGDRMVAALMPGQAAWVSLP